MTYIGGVEDRSVLGKRKLLHFVSWQIVCKIIARHLFSFSGLLAGTGGGGSIVIGRSTVGRGSIVGIGVGGGGLSVMALCTGFGGLPPLHPIATTTSEMTARVAETQFLYRFAG